MIGNHSLNGLLMSPLVAVAASRLGAAWIRPDGIGWSSIRIESLPANC
jgi:hypothetical protein